MFQLAGIAAPRALEGERQAITAPAGAPNLFPAAPLPGDLGLARARGKQEKPHIAPTSNGFLAVWSDTRSALANNASMTVGGGGPYSGPGLGTMNDIYAARLDAQGNLIDQHPIVISQASYNQSSPQVSWNGQNWLVVWYQELENDYSSYQMRAVRVSPAGAVLDATPLTIGPASNNLGRCPRPCISMAQTGSSFGRASSQASLHAPSSPRASRLMARCSIRRA